MPASSRLPRSGSAAALLEQDLDAVLLAVSVLVAVVARSVAEGLAVHPFNTSCACARLVDADLLLPGKSPVDRRNLVLELSPQGRTVGESVGELAHDHGRRPERDQGRWWVIGSARRDAAAPTEPGWTRQPHRAAQ